MLHDKVEIVRDRAGVPHIFAQHTLDVYFGLGFAMAQDRLWQMDRLRRRAFGRQAEILGSEYVQADLLHRAVGIGHVAELEVERTDPSTREILEHFVAGINRHIDACGAHLPLEFSLLNYQPEPFRVCDVIAILRAEWWSLNGRLQNLTIAEAANLLPETLREAYLTPEAAEERIVATPSSASGAPRAPAGMSDAATGSNNWAVAGSRTVSGHALLCGDPHQPFWVPSSWYEYAVHGPEDDAAGAGHTGVPGLWWGSNRAIAWSITNNAASTRDLYRERVHPDDPSLYFDAGTWRRFDEHVVEILVRGESPIRHVQRATVRGPVVNHVVPPLSPTADPPLSLRWVGQEHLDDIRAAISIGRAHDWEGFRAALRDWAVAVFNFVYADAEGHIGYQCAGRIPLRGRVVSGYRDANETADTWQAYIPYDELPRTADPSSAYVASANERVAPDDFPHPLYGAWGAGHRSARMRQAFSEVAQVDAAWCVALQNDIQSTRAQRLCPPLIELLAGTTDPDVDLLRSTLAHWDARYALESIAPTLFETFMQTWQERVARARFPDHLIELVHGHTGVAAQLIERGEPAAWFASDLRGEIVAAATETISRVRTRYGSEDNAWQWGNVHQVHWRHPLSSPERPELDIGPTPVDGGADTLRNTGAGVPPFSASGGAEYRIVVDFAHPDEFRAVQNIGNSGDPDSPHYKDQFAPWLAGDYHTIYLNRAALDSNAESTVVLESS